MILSLKTSSRASAPKKDRNSELKTPYHECKPKRYRVVVKVVDIFGNDTMKIVEVSV